MSTSNHSAREKIKPAKIMHIFDGFRNDIRIMFTTGQYALRLVTPCEREGLNPMKTGKTLNFFHW